MPDQLIADDLWVRALDADEGYHHHMPGYDPEADATGAVTYCGVVIDDDEPGPDPCCPTCRGAMDIEGIWECSVDPGVADA